jgi:putative hemolysin
MLTEIAIVLLLIAVNGVLAMSELAIVSARPARLRGMKGRGPVIAARLAEDPGRFLSTVQIGITMVGVLSGAFSGATLGARLALWLRSQGVPDDLSNTLGVGGVVLLLTYLSLIAGELVPKQLALRNAEAIAARMAPAMALLARVAAPVVWVLDRSGKVVLWLLRVSDEGKSRVTEEEVRTLLTEAHEEGVIERGEREMIGGVMRLADRSARALMTPRREVDLLDIGMTPAEALAAIRRIARPRMPVQRRETGEVLGIVLLADAFQAASRREPIVLSALLKEVPVVSEHTDALDLMQIVHATPHHMALVYDEYGQFEGIVTTHDLLETITGQAAAGADAEPAIVERADGSLLVAGWMSADEFCERLGLPPGLAGDYDTVAGLVLNLLKRIPVLGDHVEAEGWRFEVVDLDGRRIDKVLVTRMGYQG